MGRNTIDVLRNDIVKAAKDKYRRGGTQSLLWHFNDVQSRFAELVGPDLRTWGSFWYTMAFAHDAVEENLINLDDYEDAGIKEILELFTRREGETSEEHESRKLASELVEVAAIVYADAMSNAQYSEEEKAWTNEHHEHFAVARSKYLRRASRALLRYTELMYV